MVIRFVPKDLLWYCASSVKGEMMGRERGGYCMVADKAPKPKLH